MIFTNNHKKMEEFRNTCRSIRIMSEVIERNANDEELVKEALFYLDSVLTQANHILGSVNDKWASKSSDFKSYQSIYNDIYEKLVKALNMVRHRVVISEKKPEDYFSYKYPEAIKENFKKVRENSKSLDKTMKEKSQYLTEAGKKAKQVKKPQIFGMFKIVDSDKKMDAVVNSFAGNGNTGSAEGKQRRAFGSDSREDRVAESYVEERQPE